MNITSLYLENLRNHHKKDFSFSDKITIIVGQNTTGKTNIVEAVYCLALGKSFRSGKDTELITFNKELARIRALLKEANDEKKLEIVLSRGEVMRMKTPLKRFLVNDIARRGLDFIGNLKVVLFWPEHMELITDSPSLRRRYLDSVLIQIDREYRRTLLSYERGIRQRNKLLEKIREGQAQGHHLLFWNQLLIKQGNYISDKRNEFIEYINNYQIDNLANKGIRYHLEYDKSLISELRLEQYKDAEVSAGATLVGPHRDDLIFKIEGPAKQTKDLFNLSSFGSRGEQRLAVLWLKLAELAFLESKSGQKPVLLLDDIFSELDHEHREIIFHIVGHQQTIMTITDRHLVPQKYFSQAKVIEL